MKKFVLMTILAASFGASALVVQEPANQKNQKKVERILSEPQVKPVSKSLDTSAKQAQKNREQMNQESASQKAAE